MHNLGQARLALSVFPNLDIQALFETLPSEFVLGKPVLRLIAGDASDRKFYRLENSPRKAICMQFPKWEGGYGGDPLSWLGMQEALLGIGMPVPQVIHIDEKNCCIWTEDFGDDFLTSGHDSKTLSLHDPVSAKTISHYKTAINLLLEVQYPNVEIGNHPALKRAFDFEKLFFEMDFFLKHFCFSFMGLKHSSYDFEEIQKEMILLCEELGSRPRVLCHRDYHLRNVMIYQGQVKWIDFQDARMGPHAYDVVSLLRDSYLSITPDTREHLTQHYVSNLEKKLITLQTSSQADILRLLPQEFMLMGLQRNIKALGSFAYLCVEKSKPSYLTYVNQTLQTILHRNSIFSQKLNLFDKFPMLMKFMANLAEEELSQLLADKIKDSQAI